MVKKSIWGPIIWKMLHCISIKIKDENFSTEKNVLIKLVSDICNNLPCPMCRIHAMGMLKKYNINSIKNKPEFIKFIWFIHNEVNKRLKQNIFEFENVNKTYEKENFKEVCTTYYNMMINIKFSEKMMLNSFHRKEHVKKFKIYIVNNIDKFN